MYDNLSKIIITGQELQHRQVICNCVVKKKDPCPGVPQKWQIFICKTSMWLPSMHHSQKVAGQCKIYKMWFLI
jgi:hypothetical protein